MAAKEDDSIYARYFELHKQWSADPDKRQHVAALPILVATEAISHAIELLPQAGANTNFYKRGAPG